jgi:hypothetical protein
MSYALPFAKIFPKTKRGGAKNGQSPLLNRSEIEISNRGKSQTQSCCSNYLDGNTTYT